MSPGLRGVVARLRGTLRRVDDAADNALEIPRAVLGRAARIRFITPVVVIAGISALAISEIGNRQLLSTFNALQDAYERRGIVRLLREATLAAETAQRGYVLTEKGPYVEPFERARDSITRRMTELHDVTIRNPAARTLALGLETDLRARLSEMELTVRLVDSGRRKDAVLVINTDEGKRRMDHVWDSLRAFEAMEQSAVDRLTEDWLRGHDRFRTLVAGAIAVSIVLMIAAVRLMRRMLVVERQHSDLLLAEQVRLDQLVGERTAELAELADHLQSVREEEKAALARELHDELGAILTAARMDVAFARRRLAVSPDDVDAKLQRVLGYLDQSVALKRRIIEGMVPSVLHNLGLIPALESLCDEFAASTGIRIARRFDEVPPTLERPRALALYRVAQEALTNVQKHARAGTVELTLRHESEELRLRIRDDGAGVDAAGLNRLKSHGVRGMRQRMTALHGHLTITSAPGEGTTVEAWLPTVTAATRAG
ncbi:MAG: CHASE3 domain-containing protein [Burkholderiales bacterium]